MMKLLSIPSFLWAILALLQIYCIYCNSPKKPKKTADTNSAVDFDSTTISLGLITDTAIVKKFVKIYNKSEVPLVIKGIKSSCGCTALSYPKKPIIETDSMLLSFNPVGQSEYASKSIFIYTNTIPEVTEIRLTANIKFR